MTTIDYDDLCKRLRDYANCNDSDVDAAADAIAALREQLAALTGWQAIAEANAVTARIAQADNVALRQDAKRYQFIRNVCEVTYLGQEIGSDSELNAALLAGKDKP